MVTLLYNQQKEHKQGLKIPVRPPLITVIVAVKNSAGTLQRFIDSFIKQTLQRKELIIIDGGSTDETVKLLLKNAEYIDYWESKPDRGIAHAWNKALKHANGEWILFSGADDYLADDVTLEKFTQKIMEHHIKKEKIVYGAIKMFLNGGIYFDTFGIEWKQVKTIFLSQKMMIPHQACFHHNSVFKDYGTFDETFSIAIDYEFLLRVLKKEDAFFLKEYTVSHMAFGGLSSKLSTISTMQKEFDRALLKHGIKPKGYKRIVNSIIYKIIVVITKCQGELLAAKILDLIRRLQGKPPLWTRQIKKNQGGLTK
jgi:glycosyltransferase involved in cell wall biosynthesis